MLYNAININECIRKFEYCEIQSIDLTMDIIANSQFFEIPSDLNTIKVVNAYN